MQTALFKWSSGEHQITRKQILEIMRRFDQNYRGKPNFPDQGQGWFVEHDGKTYAPKVLLSLATGIARSDFHSVQARKALKSLGFELKKVVEDEEDAEQEEEAIETTFGLERDLQTALRSNIEQLEKGLKIADGGKETVVESGRIDIKAEDKNRATVVIELKAGEADRDAIGQILAYIGDLTKKNNRVRGILVAGEFAPRAVTAARVVPTLQLKKYTYKFSFEDIK